jgi:hypothetical protein
MEVALVLVASVAWGSTVDVAAITVLGVSAIVGIPILLVIALANVRAVSGGGSALPARRFATLGKALAVLRLLAVVVAALVVVVARGVTDSFDLADSCTAGIGVFDGLLAVLVAVLTGRGIARAAVS